MFKEKTFYTLSIVAVLCCILSSGCVSSRSDTIARLLRDLDTDDIRLLTESPQAPQAPNRSYDQPDRADPGLPPMSRYMPQPNTPSKQNYSAEDLEITIQPGSLIQVTVKEDAELDGNYPVNEIGAITLGYIGPIIILNKNAISAAKKITEVLIKRNFRQATVSLKIIRASYDRVHVNGDVNTPGDIAIGSGDTISLNDAILRAGGIKTSAKGARIKVVRGGLTNAMAHFAKGQVYSLKSDKGEPVLPKLKLKNNDLVTILSTATKAATVGGEKDITVLGEVKRPGVFRFSNTESCTMMHLMFKLGELSIYADKKNVKIYRKNNRGFEEEITVNVKKLMDKGKTEDDVPLEHNDRVVIPRKGFHII